MDGTTWPTRQKSSGATRLLILGSVVSTSPQAATFAMRKHRTSFGSGHLVASGGLMLYAGAHRLQPGTSPTGGTRTRRLSLARTADDGAGCSALRSPTCLIT